MRVAEVRLRWRQVTVLVTCLDGGTRTVLSVSLQCSQG